jgi:hypothetical protein
VNPFFVVWIEDLKLFRRLIRDIYFGCFAQIFFGVFLNERKIGIFHGKKNIVFVVSKDNIQIAKRTNRRFYSWNRRWTWWATKAPMNWAMM